MRGGAEPVASSVARSPAALMKKSRYMDERVHLLALSLTLQDQPERQTRYFCRARTTV